MRTKRIGNASGRWRFLRPAAWALVGLTLLSGLVLAPSPPAQANPSAGFNPSEIISDAKFYNGNAMTAAQVQSFLNQRVPRCTIGDPGKPAGGTYYFPNGGSTKLAKKCLKDERFTSRSMAANAYCSAYQGKAGESAATIIQKVGKACGLSQQTILVMLEKEQSLIQDDFPAQHQLDRAMGYACPDSGPGGSANCNTQYYGFFNQVYFGAWQIQLYKANPNGYRYKPFQTNSILWNVVESGCGASNVYINNAATAALYIYTPYRPNQAALNAGWGTGDRCSSYGNRNFYNFFNSWFGSPVITVAKEFVTLYAELGGAAGPFGNPRGSATTHEGDIRRQEFTGGAMYWSARTGSSAIRGAMLTAFNQAGGIGGRFGLPKSIEVRQPDGGYVQEFERGTATWSKGTGFGFVKGGIRTLYLSQVGAPSSFGYARGEEVALATGGYEQQFSEGQAYWSASTGPSFVRGAIRSHFLAMGGVQGSQGFPLKVEYPVKGGGYGQEFQKAIALWSPRHGSAFVKGGIRDFYVRAGGPAGAFGYPVGDEFRVQAGRYSQRFTGALLNWAENTGTIPVKGAILRGYEELGGHAGFLNQPLSPEIKREGGAFSQDFRGGTLFWTSTYGALAVKGGIRSHLILLEEQGTPLGAPRTPELPFGPGYKQEFIRGAIVWAQGTGAVVLRGAIGAAYLNDSSLQRDLGLPQGDEVRSGRGFEQEFMYGSIRWTQSEGVTVHANPPAANASRTGVDSGLVAPEPGEAESQGPSMDEPRERDAVTDESSTPEDPLADRTQIEQDVSVGQGETKDLGLQ